MRIEPERSATDAVSLEPWAGSVGQSQKELEKTGSKSDEFGDVEPLRLLASSRPRKKAKTETRRTENEVDDQADAQPKRRRRIRRSTWGMLVGVVAGPFWRSALSHFPYLAADLAGVGALLGFLVGLMHSAIAADLLLQMIGYPAALVLFFMMCYPTACFLKVVVGSAESNGDINEWPESNFGEWVFDLLLVGYMIVMSVLFSVGVAKLRQWVEPGRPESYWQLISGDKEVDAMSFLPKVLGMKHAGPTEVEPDHPVLQPGPGWRTTFIAFIAIFPLFMLACFDRATPIFVPWSPRVFFSLLKNFAAWLVVFVISGGLLGAGTVILFLGATYAPFWTFTLCSPLATVGLLVYARLLGRLSWLIART